MPRMPRMASYGFFPAAGTDYTQGQEPEIARRLRRLGRALRLHLIGISGFRTPAHSVAVGGFPNDPHTRGQASDTPGIEQVPETTLRRFGLTRPFPGTQEADHIQLAGAGGGTTTARPRGRRAGPADWLTQAGWAPNMIPIMVAVGGAESGWRVDAESPPNDDGSIDYGWLQINSKHGFDPARLKSDPVYTARAGKQIYREQGLGAWSTYNNGAYKSFMGQRPTVGFSRTRPGGDVPGAPDTTTVDNELAAFWVPGLPPGVTLPNPLDALKGASKAVNGATDFLKWISWLFHPLTILRGVEFLVGFPLIILGIVILTKMWQSAAAETAMKLLPAGRAITAARGLRRR